MKKLLALIVLLPAMVLAQYNYPLKYYITVTNNSNDTTAWFDVKDYGELSYTATARDSTHFYVIVQYSDTTATTTATAHDADIPRADAARTVGEDSLANFANVANPKGVIGNVLRNFGGNVDKVKGAGYARFVFIAPNVASKHAGLTADQTTSLIINRKRYLR